MGQKVYTISPLSHKKIKNYGEKERYYSKDRHEAIISRELWDKVHDILKKRNGRPMLNGKKHQERYSMRYAFSSKIVCGFCGANYSRRSSGKNKNGKQNIYWACMGRIDKNECEESIYIKEEILENLFIQIYNSIIDNKHKTKDKLLGAIKSVVEENHAKTKLDKLELQENNIRTKISNLIDLKLDKLTHQDIGQMDFYVRYYDNEIKAEEDNPTIGIILCSDKKDTIVKYSVLNDNKNLFASKYQLYLPTEEELAREIEKQKEEFEDKK